MDIAFIVFMILVCGALVVGFASETHILGVITFSVFMIFVSMALGSMIETNIGRGQTQRQLIKHNIMRYNEKTGNKEWIDSTSKYYEIINELIK